MKNFDFRKIRQIEADIDPIFINRWSPRAFTGGAVPEGDLSAVLEAGRLAPSASNSQPWLAIYGHRDTPDWDPLFDLLVPFNQEWCANGGALFLFLSRQTSPKGTPLVTASYDTGAFWMSMALEGFRRGYPIHGMAGFDYEKARVNFHVPAHYKVEAMACMGVPGDDEKLPHTLKAREVPSGRKSLEEVAIKAKQANVTTCLLFA